MRMAPAIRDDSNAEAWPNIAIATMSPPRRGIKSATAPAVRSCRENVGHERSPANGMHTPADQVSVSVGKLTNRSFDCAETAWARQESQESKSRDDNDDDDDGDHDYGHDDDDSDANDKPRQRQRLRCGWGWRLWTWRPTHRCLRAPKSGRAEHTGKQAKRADATHATAPLDLGRPKSLRNTPKGKHADDDDGHDKIQHDKPRLLVTQSRFDVMPPMAHGHMQAVLLP